MKTTFPYLIIILIFNFNYSIAQSVTHTLPKAPKDYSWKTLSDINAYLLLPDGWFFNAEQKGTTYAYFVTKEDYTKDPNGMFVTGVSINVFTDIGNNNAVDYANSFANNLENNNKVLFFGDYDNSVFKGKMLRIQTDDQIIHYLVFGNTKTNKLYIVFFESSIAKWKENEEYGKTIMTLLAFDPEY